MPGFALAKLMLALPRVRLAVALTVAFTVRLCVEVAAWARPARPNVDTVTAARPTITRTGRVCSQTLNWREIIVSSFPCSGLTGGSRGTETDVARR